VAKLAHPRLRTKYAVDEELVESTLALIALRGELVSPRWRIRVCRDPKDNLVIEAAVAGRASFVVTGDDDLLTLRTFEGVRLLAPRDFLAQLGSVPAGASTPPPLSPGAG
jgi:predicted nucleic acid-binding protein